MVKFIMEKRPQSYLEMQFQRTYGDRDELGVTNIVEIKTLMEFVRDEIDNQ